MSVVNTLVKDVSEACLEKPMNQRGSHLSKRKHSRLVRFNAGIQSLQRLCVTDASSPNGTALGTKQTAIAILRPRRISQSIFDP